MNSFHFYIFCLFICGVFFSVTAYWTLRSIPGSPGRWESLPRNIIIGLVIATLDLVICIPLSKPLVPLWMVSWLIPMAIAGVWIIYQFLDYIFARALGGLMILAAHYLLYSSFMFRIPAKPFFSVICFFIGTAGIFFCGKPYLLRDFIRKTAAERKWRIAAGITSLIFASTFFLEAILEWSNKMH